MPFDKLIHSWLYSWMINNFIVLDGVQVYTRYANTKGISYRSMYDRLLKAIKVDTDIIGTPTNRQNLTLLISYTW